MVLFYALIFQLSNYIIIAAVKKKKVVGIEFDDVVYSLDELISIRATPFPLYSTLQ